MNDPGKINLFMLKKLVRDKRFESMQEKKRQLKERCLAGTKQELLNALHVKGIEEIKELEEVSNAEDPDREKVIDELTDVQQIVNDLTTLSEQAKKITPYSTKITIVCEKHRIDIQNVLQLTLEKAQTEGGFLGGHYVEWVKIAQGDEWHDYFVKKYGITSSGI